MAALADLPELAVRVSRALDVAEIAHAVSGAVAMAAHGYVRATQDLDVLVDVSAIRLPEVFDIVRGLGFSGEDRELITAIRERHVAALHAGPVTIDILVPVLPYHRTLLDRAVRVEMPGGTVPVVAVEDLIVLKMLWHRAKDIPDVHALIAGSPTLTSRYVRETLAEILPAEDSRHAEIESLMERFGSTETP